MAALPRPLPAPSGPRRRAVAAFGLLALVWLVGAPALAAPAPPAAEPCLKLVFGRFCLGGDVNALLQREAPALRLDEGERMALTYYDGPEPLYVLAWRGRIYKVVRSYRVATQLRYDELYVLLQDKYGPGEDQSRFPATADTAGRRQIAIRRGEGLARHGWRVDGGWRIELGWTREQGLALAYVAEALDSSQAATSQSGF